MVFGEGTFPMRKRKHSRSNTYDVKKGGEGRGGEVRSLTILSVVPLHPNTLKETEKFPDV